MGNTRREVILIRIINAICIFFAIAGVALSIFASSRAMLLDGLYSFVQSIFILISAFIVRLLVKRESRNYQFGYAAFEPFFIVIRNLFLSLMIVVLALDAFVSILSGGYLIKANIALIFTLFSVVICGVVALSLYHFGSKWNSPIILNEARSWLCDTLLSVAVLIGFISSYLFSYFGYTKLASLVDPFITILFVIFLLPMLIMQIVKNTHELLGGAPSKEVQARVRMLVSQYKSQLDIKEIRIYSTKHGRMLLFNIYIQLGKEKSLYELDHIRKKILEDIQSVWSWVDADVIFTIDPSWYTLSQMAPARY